MITLIVAATMMCAASMQGSGACDASGSVTPCNMIAWHVRFHDLITTRSNDWALMKAHVINSGYGLGTHLGPACGA